MSNRFFIHPCILAVTVFFLASLYGCTSRHLASEEGSVIKTSTRFNVITTPKSLAFSIKDNLSGSNRFSIEPKIPASLVHKRAVGPNFISFDLAEIDRPFDSLTITYLNNSTFQVSYKGIKAACLKETIVTSKDELIYGVWEHSGTLELTNNGIRGEYLHNGAGEEVRGANARAPFMFSNKGYAVYIPTTSDGAFDFTNKGRVSFCINSPELTYFVLLGDSPKELFKAYNDMAGPVKVPPLWAYGPHFWRDDWTENLDASKNATQRIKDDIASLAKHNIALSAIWIDRPYGTGKRGWGNFDFSPAFPDASSLFADLNKQNIKVMVWIANRSDEGMLAAAVERNLLYKDANISDWPALAISESDSYNWFKEQLSKLVKLNISGFKIDRGDEDEMPRDVANLNAALLPKLASEVFEENETDDFFLISRNAADTARRYTAVWNGDPKANWFSLKESLIHGLRSSLINFPVWGSDTGGYSGIPSTELLIRWLQLSAFSPIMEIPITHSNKIVWRDFGAKVRHALSMYTHLHKLLSPYIARQVLRSNREGVPVMRPIFFDHPEDSTAWQINDQYFFGDNIIVAPILEPGQTSRRVYLPTGAWREAFGKQKLHTGPNWIEVNVSLRSIPVFVRESAKVSDPILDAIIDFNS